MADNNKIEKKLETELLACTTRAITAQRFIEDLQSQINFENRMIRELQDRIKSLKKGK